MIRPRWAGEEIGGAAASQPATETFRRLFVPSAPFRRGRLRSVATH